MRWLSTDLRQRIVSAYLKKEGSYAELAKRFAVSKAVVGKLVRQQRRLKTLEPQVHLRGRKPAICGAKQEELREHLRSHPDATLRERIDALGLDCTINTLWKTQRKMGWRFKKSRRVPPSRIVPMSQ
jgi:transposase